MATAISCETLLARIRHAALTLIALVVIIDCTACATLPPVQNATFKVVVDNQEFDDLQVYIERGGALVLLGTVPGLDSRTYNLSSVLLGSDGCIGLVARTRAGSNSLRSPFITAHSGQVVSWKIEKSSFGHNLTVK